MCPTYYSDDRMLDVLFGERPTSYLEDLGRRLDPRVGVYWTGEEICTREYSPGHLTRVTDALRRKPTLWDNYPVNDGPRMSRFLHLRGFTGRTGEIAPHVAAHAINPALQPHLTLIPAATLAASYREGAAYATCGPSGRRRARWPALISPPCSRKTCWPCRTEGIDHLHADRERLRARDQAVDHPMAAEVVRWLDGA